MFRYLDQYIKKWPPLWSSDQSSWLQIKTSGLDSRRYQIFWEVVGLERGPLSHMSTIEKLLGRNNSGSGLESREYGRRDPSRWQRDTLHPQKLALTSPTSVGRSVGIVHSRTQSTEFVFCFSFLYIKSNAIPVTGRGDLWWREIKIPHCSRPAMANYRPAASFTPALAMSEVYFKKY
jgi:hypothetical protein